MLYLSRPIVVFFDGRYAGLMRYQAENLDLPMVIKASKDSEYINEDVCIDASVAYWIKRENSKIWLMRLLESIVNFIGESRSDKSPLYLPGNYPRFFDVLSPKQVSKTYDDISGKTIRQAASLLMSFENKVPVDDLYNPPADIKSGVFRDTETQTALRALASLPAVNTIAVLGRRILERNYDRLKKTNKRLVLVCNNYEDVVKCRNKFKDVKTMVSLEYKSRRYGLRSEVLTVPLLETTKNVEALGHAYKGLLENKWKRVLISYKQGVEYKALRYAFPGTCYDRIRISRDPKDAKMRPAGHLGTRVVYSPTSYDCALVFMDDGYHLRVYRDDYLRHVPDVLIFDIRD